MFLFFFIILLLVFQLQEFEGKETALLIDRYKYMDLYPCSQMELKALGYRVSILAFCFQYIFDDSVNVFVSVTTFCVVSL